jgi:DNA-binding MurR/RpiR family transcriptional regulator
VTITDSKLSPAAQLSKFTLIAPANSYNFANSYTGCISIINLLVTLIIHMEKDQAEMNLRAREEALQGLHLHYGNEVPSISLIRGVKKDN